MLGPKRSGQLHSHLSSSPVLPTRNIRCQSLPLHTLLHSHSPLYTNIPLPSNLLRRNSSNAPDDSSDSRYRQFLKPVRPVNIGSFSRHFAASCKSFNTLPTKSPTFSEGKSSAHIPSHKESQSVPFPLRNSLRKCAINRNASMPQCQYFTFNDRIIVTAKQISFLPTLSAAYWHLLSHYTSQSIPNQSVPPMPHSQNHTSGHPHNYREQTSTLVPIHLTIRKSILSIQPLFCHQRIDP